MLRGCAGMTHPVRRIGFLLWPGTRPLTLALAEEALRVSQRVHPDVHYELLFLQAEPGAEVPLDAVGNCQVLLGRGSWKVCTSSCW